MEKLISNNFKKGGYNGISFNFAWNIYITNNNTDFNNIINITYTNKKLECIKYGT